jgi:predicted DCC family thiol-disulfide oxidoreductase YuxK
LDKFNLPLDALDSIVLVEESGYHVKSTAVLRIVRHLGTLGFLFYTLIIVPRPWRDKIYDLVVAHRYHWFGRTDRCAVSQAHLNDRFLD